MDSNTDRERKTYILNLLRKILFGSSRRKNAESKTAAQINRPQASDSAAEQIPRRGGCSPEPRERRREERAPVGRDMGNAPTLLNMKSATSGNPFYRNTLWTGEHSQLTLMSIPIGEEIGTELHNENDQFIKIEDGIAEVFFGNSPEELSTVGRANSEYAVIIPAGIYHNIKNVGSTPLKLYSVYSPAHHPYGTVNKTKPQEK